ncbi:MAG: competence protein ComL [Chryseobacterium gambrini]|nr:competence protein ComL [Chryseobacterium gambrini]
MKKLFSFTVMIIIVLNSCETTHYRTTSGSVKKPKTNSNAGNRTSTANQTELEYQTLLKTYKSETAAVLTDLLNGSEDSPNTSITVENNSRCNMVLTISGNNYFKKIPIGANKIGSAMVPKNQNYNISGMVCNSVYQKTKFISSSYNVTLSN